MVGIEQKALDPSVKFVHSLALAGRMDRNSTQGFSRDAVTFRPKDHSFEHEVSWAKFIANSEKVTRPLGFDQAVREIGKIPNSMYFYTLEGLFKRFLQRPFRNDLKTAWDQVIREADKLFSEPELADLRQAVRNLAGRKEEVTVPLYEAPVLSQAALTLVTSSTTEPTAVAEKAS